MPQREKRDNFSENRESALVARFESWQFHNLSQPQKAVLTRSRGVSSVSQRRTYVQYVYTLPQGIAEINACKQTLLPRAAPSLWRSQNNARKVHSRISALRIAKANHATYTYVYWKLQNFFYSLFENCNWKKLAQKLTLLFGWSNWRDFSAKCNF